MTAVDQRRMLRCCSSDQPLGGAVVIELQRDRDNLQAVLVQLGPQCLPPGQVERATSIRSPRNKDDLLATQ